MNNFFKFRSLLDKSGEGMCYTVYKSSHDNPAQTYRNMMVMDTASAWLAYNDGMVQHSPDHSFPVEQWTDFWYSLATHLKDNPADIEIVAQRWYRCIDKQDIEFAASVKYKEPVAPKYTVNYYSLRERKMSTSPSKVHDKRWSEVHSYLDGSLTGCIRVLADNMGCDRRQYLANVLAIRDVLEQQGRTTIPHLEVCKAAGLNPYDHRTANTMLEAFGIVSRMVEAEQLREQALRGLDCFTSNRENERLMAERKAEQERAEAEQVA